MSSEIKCPVCEKWSIRTGKIDDRCPNCNEQFDAVRLQYAEENRINAEKIKKDSYLIIKEGDDPVVQMFKEFVNWLRWATFYGISVIYVAIAVMIIVYGLIML
ncbi:MAG: hypothetical protein M3O71_05185 [Bacteroidota bacterium]|nr:hypothetical protein [Bacteroidota bacterium]